MDLVDIAPYASNDKCQDIPVQVEVSVVETFLSNDAKKSCDECRAKRLDVNCYNSQYFVIFDLIGGCRFISRLLI